jgi:hypothetical protein
MIAPLAAISDRYWKVFKTHEAEETGLMVTHTLKLQFLNLACLLFMRLIIKHLSSRVIPN